MAKNNTILFIINGMTKNEGVVSVSGGDMRLLEMVRTIPEKEKFLLTTPNGIEFFDRYPEVKYNHAFVIPHDLKSGIVSNLAVSIKSWLLWKSGAKRFREGIVYSSCEHLYDILPALRLKLFNNCEWYAVYHWVEDYPWREKRGNTPLVQRYAYWLNRWVSGFIIKYFSDHILAVSEPTREKLIELKKISPVKIKTVYCGVNYDTIQEIVGKLQFAEKTYDAVFMKRLNYGKGVLDLLKIWKEVVKVKPNARLAIIGDGTPDVLEKVNAYIQKNSLTQNVTLLGVIYDMREKFSIIASSKVFLLPTHEENWAIVVGEAMAAGTPVIVSRLDEIVPIWKDNVVWCDVGDIKAFATETLKMINDPDHASRISKKASEFITRYDWQTIGRNELN